MLGLRSSRYPLLNLGQAIDQVKTLASDFGLGAPLTTKVGNLTVGQQQKVEIIKALFRGARLLILDEPTAVLLPQETDELFQLIQKLLGSGVSIVFISHKLKEVLSISDRVTVMRRGRVIQTFATNQTTAAELAESMVGQAVELTIAKSPSQPGPNSLELLGVSARDEVSQQKLDGLTLALRAGEIHGLAG